MFSKKHLRIFVVVLILSLLTVGMTLSSIGASVTPISYGGNDPVVASPVGCTDLKSFKIDPPTGGLHTNIDGFEVTLTYGENNTVDFTANYPVYYVFAKGGVQKDLIGGPAGGYLYDYRPDGVTADKGLYALNNQSISHITFYYCVTQTTNIPVTKFWIGGEDRPDVTINLLANGTEVKEITLANGATTYTFMDLPVYDMDGNLIVYTITEDMVVGYATSIDGFVVTNTYIVTYSSSTAWGRYDGEEAFTGAFAKWFPELERKLNWGWTNGPFTQVFGKTVYLDLFAGNVGPNPTVDPVGQVVIAFGESSTDDVTVTYEVYDENLLTDVHFYIGTTALPMNNGKYTNAPGSFPYDISDGVFDVEEKKFTMVINKDDEIAKILSGDFYIAAHAVVKSPTNSSNVLMINTKTLDVKIKGKK